MARRSSRVAAPSSRSNDPRSARSHARHRQEFEDLDRRARRHEMRMILQQIERRLLRRGIENPPTCELPAPTCADPLTLPALATGLPMSTIPLPARRAHAIHASMPALACCGVAFFICSEADTVD